MPKKGEHIISTGVVADSGLKIRGEIYVNERDVSFVAVRNLPSLLKKLQKTLDNNLPIVYTVFEL